MHNKCHELRLACIELILYFVHICDLLLLALNMVLIMPFVTNVMVREENFNGQFIFCKIHRHFIYRLRYIFVLFD